MTDKFRGTYKTSVTSVWLESEELVKYYNKVAHYARVTFRQLRKEGYNDYKIRHYIVDEDEFKEGVPVYIVLSEVIYLYKNEEEFN